MLKKTLTRQTYFVSDDLGEIATESKPLEFSDDTIEIHRLESGATVVGYLMLDEFCKEPGYDMWEIVQTDNQKGEGAIYEALGLDSHGEPDFGLIDQAKLAAAFTIAAVDDEGVSTQLASAYKDRLEDFTPDQYREFLMDAAGDEFAYRLDDYGNPTTMIGASLLESVRVKLFAEGRADGSIGSKNAVLLNRYEHGDVSYRISGNSGFDFDLSRGAAMWLPTPEYIDCQAVLPDETPEQFRKRLLEWAAQDCETYSNWANGWVYGYAVEVRDASGNLLEEDSCWGLYGDEYAVSEMSATAAEFVKSFQGDKS